MMRVAIGSILWTMVLGLGLGAAGSGCVLRETTVVNRFHGEFVCPNRDIKVEKINNDLFRATGCNRRANYRCSGEYGEFCERIGAPQTIDPNLGPGDEAAPPPSSPEK